jgi:translin
MTNLDALRQGAQAAFAATNAAREIALPKSRAAVRHCANAIRAIHRDDEDGAQALIEQARALIDAMRADLIDHPNIYFAGFVEDAQKEFAEAGITVALIRGRDLPTPDDLRVEWAAYLNGLGEAVGELRRHVLDLLRQGRFSECEALLGVMDEVFGVLTALDFPDAITNGLRRTTDNARGIIERTRGDLTSAALSAHLSAQLTLVADLLRHDGHGHPAEEQA